MITPVLMSLGIRKIIIRLSSQRAAAILLTVLFIGGIVTEIATAGIFLAYFAGQSGFGVKLSAEALAAAQAGIQDGIIKVVRNKNIDYNQSGSPYTITVDNSSAQVTICRDYKTVITACDTAISGGGKDEITSLGKSLSKRRELRAFLNVATTTGQVRVESIEEISIQ